MKLFVDTSALVALFVRNDKNHEKAVAIFDDIRMNKIKLCLTDYIFDECITTVLSLSNHATTVQIGDFILSSHMIEFIWLDESSKLKTWDFFKHYSDKKFSYTDCSSFIIMKELGLKDYFGFDRHFQQAGFLAYHP